MCTAPLIVLSPILGALYASYNLVFTKPIFTERLSNLPKAIQPANIKLRLLIDLRAHSLLEERPQARRKQVSEGALLGQTGRPWMGSLWWSCALPKKAGDTET